MHNKSITLPYETQYDTSTEISRELWQYGNIHRTFESNVFDLKIQAEAKNRKCPIEKMLHNCKGGRFIKKWETLWETGTDREC